MKKDFVIRKISVKRAKSLLKKYHYLSKESKGFLSKVVYGLFEKGTDNSGLFPIDKLVGVAVYSGISVWQVLKGMLGRGKNAKQSEFFELNRSCLLPEIQKSEHNLSSWFLSRTLKLLKKEYKVQLVLSYADTRYHLGIVYQAVNFKYYGLAPKRKDYLPILQNGKFGRQPRGSIKGIKGVWTSRPRKHRYLYVFNKKLKILWEEKPYPIKRNITTEVE